MDMHLCRRSTAEEERIRGAGVQYRTSHWKWSYDSVGKVHQTRICPPASRRAEILASSRAPRTIIKLDARGLDVKGLTHLRHLQLYCSCQVSTFNLVYHPEFFEGRIYTLKLFNS